MVEPTHLPANFFALFAAFAVTSCGMNLRIVVFIVLVSGWSVGARAQFTAALLQDERYWGDGKAEFNIYDAQEMRYGKPRACEIIHVFVREPFADRELVKAEPGSKAGTFPVLKLNQILNVPTGLYSYQQMHSAFWRGDSGELIKSTLTSNDGCGNTYKEFRALGGLRGLIGRGFSYEWRTYWEGMSAGTQRIAVERGAIFYDELPWRVRTIDFSNKAGAFATAIAPTIIHSKRGSLAFEVSSVEWAVRPDEIAVRVERQFKDGAQRDDFVLEPHHPHRVREWRKADGSTLKLQRSLKLDYWNYNQPGDKERAEAASAAEGRATANP